MRIRATAPLVLLVMLVGCGSASTARDRVVVRIGRSTITSTELRHWMSAMALGHHVSVPPLYTSCVAHRHALTPSADETELHEKCAADYRQLHEQALGFLIAERWLSAEATNQGVGVTAKEVQQQLALKERAYTHGERELRESLVAIGRTLQDLEVEIRAELAARKLKQRLIAQEAKPTFAEIATYYSRHIAHYRLEERRDFELVENLHSEAAARQLSKEAAHGKSLTKLSLKESQARGALDIEDGKRAIERAIFHTKLSMLTDPISINGYYFLAKVTHIMPPRLQPLAEVRDAIATKLIAAHQRQTLAAFIAAWRSRWTARTDCAPGEVIQKCRQFDGNSVVEDPLSFT